MANFISDDDMQKIESLHSAGPKDVISDDDMAKLEAFHNPPESTARQLTRQFINQGVPIAGAVLGGAIATPEAPGVGTMVGGAAGYAAGKNLARVLAHHILGDDLGPTVDQDPVGTVKQTASDLRDGGVMEATGLLAGKALEAIPSAGQSLKSYAEGKMAKSMGAGAREFRDPEAARAVGRFGLDNNIKGPMTSAEDALANAQDLKEAAGKKMGNVFGQIDEAVGPSVNPLDTAVRVEKELAPEYRTPINKSEVGQMENTMESILARGDQNITLKEAQNLKKEIDAVAYPKGKAPPAPTPKQQMAQDASSIIRDEIDKAAQKGAESIGSEDLLKQLADARKQYGLSKDAENILTKQVGKEGAGVGSKIDFTLDPIAFGKSVVQKFGPSLSSMQAIGADKVSKMLLKSPEMQQMAQQNPKAFRSILDSLAQDINGAIMPQSLPRAASSQDNSVQNAPTKGPEKWANDGAAKIQQHDSSMNDPQFIEQLKASKKGKDLLIQASDLKPGTKAMDRLVTQIKSHSKKGGA